MLNKLAGPYWTHSFIPDVTEVKSPPDAMQRYFARLCFDMKQRGMCYSSMCAQDRMLLSNKMKFIPMHINFLISIN